MTVKYAAETISPSERGGQGGVCRKIMRTILTNKKLKEL